MAEVRVVDSRRCQDRTRWERTDWQEIVGLYDVLLQTWPSPVVALNRAVAVGFAFGPQRGLSMLDDLAEEPQLAVYPYLWLPPEPTCCAAWDGCPTRELLMRRRCTSRTTTWKGAISTNDCKA